MDAANDKFAYQGVEFSRDGVAELSGDRRVVFVRKEDIQGIEMARGSGAENPLLQTGFGGCLAALGVIGIRGMMAGYVRMFRYELGFMFFGALGVWLVWEALRKRTFLLVLLRSDRRKLFFTGRVDKAALAEFVNGVERDLGYHVKM